MVEGFKPTQFREFYKALGILKDEEVTAVAQMHAADPELLLYRLAKDLATVSEYDAISEPFHDEHKRTPLPDPPTPLAAIGKTEHFASHLATSQSWTVDDGDKLGFRYVDREIFPLRQTARGGPRPARRSLDLLLVSDDGLPIVGELKIGTDKPTYFALVQALMYAIELSSPSQRSRLADHNANASFQWPPEGPFLDIYLVAFDPPSIAADNNRKRSFDATELISGTLVTDERCNSVIRRIVYLDGAVRDDRLAFTKKFAFGPGT